MKLIRKIFFIYLLCVFNLSQSQVVKEGVFDESINGVQLFNPNTNDQTSFFKLGDDYFILSFDILDKPYENLYYKIDHYDRNWNKSTLFESEYLEGFLKPNIRNYKTSFNTLQKYTNYKVNFPNSDTKLKKSGNYTITVYNSQNKALFTKKFSFYEPLLGVKVSYNRYSDSKYPLKNQKVKVEAKSINSNINSAYVDLTILKNNNWHEAKSNIKPQFVNSNSFTFDQNSNSFEGGNEFNTFDAKNINIQGLGIADIKKYEPPLPHIILYPIQAYPPIYYNSEDVNGAFYFRRLDGNQERDASNEADYINVSFSITNNEKLEGKDLYVVGMFNNYNMDDSNKLSLDVGSNLYYKTIKLKQGYYNYTIVSKDKDGAYTNEASGSFWETENLYQAIIYYKDISDSYDRIIGYGEIRLGR